MDLKEKAVTIVTAKNFYKFMSIVVIVSVITFSVLFYKSYLCTKMSEKLYNALMAAGVITAAQDKDFITKNSLKEQFMSYFKAKGIFYLIQMNNKNQAYWDNIANETL